MKRKIAAVAVLLFAACLMASQAVSQEDKKPVSGAQQSELSIYGEVQSVSPDAKSLKVLYYDYDTDDEKTAEIQIAGETKLENAAGLKDIKQGDWVDVLYKVSGSRNIADSIIVEKEEDILVSEDSLEQISETLPEE